MRGGSRAGVLMALVVAAGCMHKPARPPGPPAADWRTIEERGCGFRIDLPGPPTHRTEQRGGASAYHRSDSYQVVLDIGYGYVVSCLREPGDALREKTPEAILDEMSQTKATGGVLPGAERREIPAGRCRGREERSRIQRNDVGIVVISRSYVAGDHAYALVATAPDEPVGRAHASRFLDSFRAAACDDGG